MLLLLVLGAEGISVVGTVLLLLERLLLMGLLMVVRAKRVGIRTILLRLLLLGAKGVSIVITVLMLLLAAVGAKRISGRGEQLLPSSERLLLLLGLGWRRRGIKRARLVLRLSSRAKGVSGGHSVGSNGGRGLPRRRGGGGLLLLWLRLRLRSSGGGQRGRGGTSTKVITGGILLLLLLHRWLLLLLRGSSSKGVRNW